jgi:FkbM family methyltransferase
MINQAILNEYIYDSENDEKNYNLALEYERCGQLASALTFYLRTADRTDNDNLRYVCLIKLGILFQKSGNRNMSAKYMFQSAISLFPNNPQAYIYLARLHESVTEYNDCYTVCNIALNIYDNAITCPDYWRIGEYKKLKYYSDLEYHSLWCLLYEKAISSYWINLTKESRTLLKQLLDEHWNYMDNLHKTSVEDNLCRLGIGPKEEAYTMYNEEKYDAIRYKFKNSNKIDKNYSQVMQDIFVLSMLDGKRNGTFLEIGGGDPELGNNTLLLEENYGWTGVSIESNFDLFKKYRLRRPHINLLNCDALDTDYDQLLTDNFNSEIIDYLQLDIEPARNTYECLLKIPFDKFKFRVITYEHDNYVDTTKKCKKNSRKFLEKLGYVLVVPNVSPDGKSDFEDWWVHPDLVDDSILNLMKVKSTDDVVKIDDYFHPFDFHKNFDWGVLNEKDIGIFKINRDYVQSEMIEGNYTRHFDVNPGDVVFDIGSSWGPFTFSILNKNPKEVHCFEPNEAIFKTSVNNLDGYDNVILNNIGIGRSTAENVSLSGVFNDKLNEDKESLLWSSSDLVNTIKFSDYIKQHNIEKIDFLKTDCEGGEYDIFNNENLEWIVNNVKSVSGEFHTVTQETKEKFKHFRDLYLTKAVNINVFTYSVQGFEYWTNEIWNDKFIDENLNFCNITFQYNQKETDLSDLNFYAVSKQQKNTVFVVDNFYEKPELIRDFALNQEFDEGGLGRGYIGRRTSNQYLFDGLKESFERVMGKTITKWEEYGMNGRFQVAWSGEPLVYHCDNQMWGGMIYLTPNAPFNCGTTMYACKKTRARTYYDDGWDDYWKNTPGDCHLDGTPFEPVDVIGSVYNRLVIFDASCIHSASQYFGTNKENARLWQMFFFDTIS